MRDNKQIAVIGAGIVGLSTSYYLQSSGHQVTIFDQNDPGSGTSRGHASVIADYGVPALNQPDIWKNLFRYTFSNNSPLSIKWSYLPKMFPWIFKFLQNCNSNSMNYTAEHMTSLLKNALQSYETLLREIGATDLVTHKGVLYVWMNEKEKPTHDQIEIRKRNNVEQVSLSKDEILDLEPNLSSSIKGGWYFPRAHHTLNPDKILNKLFLKFTEKMGKFLKEKVVSVNHSFGKFSINNKNYDCLIVCGGAFSKDLVNQLENKSIPLETERGYHLEFLGTQEYLTRPTCLIDSGMYLTPLEYGIRAAGTVELAGTTKKVNKSRLNYIHHFAKQLIPKLQEYQNSWLGFRPTLPDCLPIISKSPSLENLYYGFGHNHLGWTLGPITGKVITGLVNGETQHNPAFSIDRYL